MIRCGITRIKNSSFCFKVLYFILFYLISSYLSSYLISSHFYFYFYFYVLYLLYLVPFVLMSFLLPECLICDERHPVHEEKSLSVGNRSQLSSPVNTGQGICCLFLLQGKCVCLFFFSWCLMTTMADPSCQLCALCFFFFPPL